MQIPPIVLYGIPNCDTVRKARAWCDVHSVAYQFHDFKKSGVPDAMLRGWLEQLGAHALINQRGTTWRQLNDATRASVNDSGLVAAVMQAHPSLIKRPLVDWGPQAAQRFTVGFDPDLWMLLSASLAA